MLLSPVRPDIRAAARRLGQPGNGRGGLAAYNGRGGLAAYNGRTRLVAVIVGSVLLGCTGGSPQAQAVPLAELAAEQDAYDGSVVIAEGTVQTHDEPRHYWIEDTEQNRVELFPPELLEGLVGQRIRVTGRFTFRDDRGRGIDVDELEVMGSTPTALSSTLGAGRGRSGPTTVIAAL